MSEWVDYWKAHTPASKGEYKGRCGARYPKRQRGMYNRSKAYREVYLTEGALLNFQSNMWKAEANRRAKLKEGQANE
jgi:hypothetical protein